MGDALRRIHERIARTDGDGEPLRLYFGPMDSIGEGTGLDRVEERWINLVKDAIAQRRGAPSPSVGYLPVAPVAGPVSARWSGHPGDEVGWDGIGQRSWIAKGDESTHRETTVDCDRLVAFYNRGAGYGAFEIRVDGAVAATVDSYQIAPGPTAATWDSGPIEPGDHTLRFTTVDGASARPSPTFAVNIAGVMPFAGNFASGVQLWDGGHSGAPSWVPPDSELGHVALVDPDVVFIGYGANDATYDAVFPGSFGPDQCAERFVESADAIRRAAGRDPAAVFVALWGRGDLPADVWPPYRDAIRAAAETYGAAFVDVLAELGWQGERSDLSDGTHPNAAGSRAIADVVIRGLEIAGAPVTGPIRTGDG